MILNAGKSQKQERNSLSNEGQQKLEVVFVPFPFDI